MKQQKARLEEHYEQNIRPALASALGIANPMAIPKINKVVVNIGVSTAVSDSKVLPFVEQTVAKITGQAPLRTKAKKSIASFKLREDLPIGVMVTLRRRNMYEFLDKLINLALPKVRDFQGINTRLDGQGNYNLGIKEWTIFPELENAFNEKMYGMNVTIHTSAETDEQGYELLKQFGMPFKKK
jgi:large subunit ribosomal protein L5